MNEIWLQSNRRTVVAIALAIGLVGLLFAVLSFGMMQSGSVVAARVSGFMAAIVIVAAAAAGYLGTRPRLAFDGRKLRIHIGTAQPALIPIELIEGFLLGKGPSYLSGKDDYKTETSTLIVRIAERAPEWEKVPTNVRVAAWCGHYVTLRGTWTEPLSVDVVNRLNQRLYEVQQAAKQSAANSPAAQRSTTVTS
jgi:hypothetical protein